MRLLQKAQKYLEQGKSLLQDHNKGVDWNDSIQRNFKQSLTLRESILGRYHNITAQSYAGLGSVYNQFGDPRAIVAYRTCYRINSFLYGKCNGPITNTFKDVLLKRGLNQSSIDEIQRDILRSMQFEIEGDLLRRIANRKAAIIEYRKAAKLEEIAFGRDNPDLAYLWRKMAVLCSIRKGMIRSIDFGLADRMNNQKWIKGFETSLFEPVCGAIQRGDMFYEDLLFDHAVGEYANAMHIGKQCSEDAGETSSFPEPKPRSNNSKRSQRSSHSQISKRSPKHLSYQNPSIAHDLRQLLYGESNKKEDGVQSTYPSRIEVQEGKEHIFYKSAQPSSPVKKEILTEESVSETNRVHDSKLKENSQPEPESTPIVSNYSKPKGGRVQNTYPSSIEVQEWKEDLFHKAAELLSPVKKENLMEESVSESDRVRASKLEENSQPDSASMPIVSSSSRPIPLTKADENEEISPQNSTGRKPEKPKGSRSSKNSHSRRRRAASASISKPSSESSLMVGSNMESTSDLGKPHSMPSLSMAHDSLQPLKPQGSKEVAHVRPRSARLSRPWNADIASILLRSPIPIKPGSESALFNRAAQNAAKHHNRHVAKPQSMPSLLVGPPHTPLAEAKGTTAPFLENATGEKSLQGLAASVSLPEQVTKPSRHSSRKSEMASVLPESETTTASLATRSYSERSLSSRDSDPYGSVHRKSLFERFISESAKVQAALDNESGATSTKPVGPPLFDMMAHVQEVSGLLQRQTLRLKNKLGVTGMSEHGEILVNSNSKLADLENNMDVVSEIELLFESCAKILNVAMITVGEDAVDNEAMDEHRKTFALENLFLDQLRKTFAEVGANLKGGSMVDSLRRLRRPSGGGPDPPNMSKEEDIMSDGASFADTLDSSGGLSMVYEDNSNCSIEM